ncbi:MAG: hypothetical protein COB34_05280 [Methylophilaceae bacterium]|nr:MAG: hypothetical protein COB34_05280 [Methylophilaceae bacterium]
MKRLLLVLALTILVAACASTSPITKKTDQPTSKDQTNTGMVLPTEEKAFVKAIRNFDRKAIIAQWGEPAKADDVKIKGTNKIIASIWHYHYVNTDENGNYFETTELDFIDDKVVQVVFLNNDGSDTVENKSQPDEIPKN